MPFKNLENFLTQSHIPFQKDVPLSQLTTVGIGARVPYWILPATVDQLLSTAHILQKLTIPVWIHGQGSNMLFHLDQDPYPGVLLSWLPTKAQMPLSPFEPQLIHSGLRKSQLATFLSKHKIQDAIWLHGIPGTLAGGLAMNAGTPLGCFSDIVHEVTWINLKSQTFSQSHPQKDQFGYRSQTLWNTDQLITECSFIFRSPDESTSFAEQFARARQYRKQTQPLTDKSFGSTFRNPKPQFAGALISESGLKGFQVGEAMISPHHSNFFINTGQAQSHDMLTLIKTAQEKIFKDHGIELVPEVKIVSKFDTLSD